jgi:hypothetical protein
VYGTGVHNLITSYTIPQSPFPMHNNNNNNNMSTSREKKQFAAIA